MITSQLKRSETIENIVILGGGSTGVETATTLSTVVESSITILESGTRLLLTFALMTGELAEPILRRKGVQIRTETRAGAEAQAVVYLVQENEAVAAFALADVIRDESRQAIDALHRMDIEVAILTGDSEDVAQAVAQELGIDTYFAEVLPEDKDEKIVELQEQGKLVAMVGDGVNDAPALTCADVGIAIGSGTDVAVESADIILMENDPLDVVWLIKLSRASYRKMQQNIVWAAGYNVFAIPLAAGVLAQIGILLSPAVGAILMSASTVIVAVNAQFLRQADLGLPSVKESVPVIQSHSTD